MLIAAKKFENPSEGIHKLTITEVQDLGVVDGKYGPKERLRVVFDVTDEQGKDGQNLKLFLNGGKSFGPKSTLFLKLLGPMGIVVKNAENFETDDLVGLKLTAVVEHNTGADGKVYANLGSILKNPNNRNTKPTNTQTEEF